MVDTEVSRKRIFLQGMKDAFPIGFGYFAVALSIGIAAKNAGFNPLQTGLMSLFCNTASGQYAGIAVISGKGTYLELIMLMIVANIRYILLSMSLSQKVAPKTSAFHRVGVSFDITDELYGLEIARPGRLSPWYVYGAIAATGPLWWTGSILGCVVGNLLPEQIANALGVSLFGMFLAVIIPKGKDNKVVGGVIAVCFVCSYIASILPGISAISSGARTVILTVIIAFIAAVLFPHTEED